jgi:hypothetical protein
VYTIYSADLYIADTLHELGVLKLRSGDLSASETFLLQSLLLKRERRYRLMTETKTAPAPAAAAPAVGNGSWERGDDLMPKLYRHGKLLDTDTGRGVGNGNINGDGVQGISICILYAYSDIAPQ